MKIVLSVLAIVILATTCGAQTRSKTQTRPASKARAPEVQASTPESKPAEKKEEEDCGCDAPTDAYATVNGVKILKKDVDESIKDRLQELQNQMGEARKQQLESEINSRLLQAEAARLRIPPQKLLEREVAAKVKEPTEAEAQAFYDQNRAQIQGEFNEVKPQIISYLRNQRQEAEAKKLADK